MISTRPFFVKVILQISAIFFYFGSAIASDLIGMSLPVTGRSAPIAQQMQTGAALAIQKVRKAGYDIQLKFADDKCAAENASDVARSLNDASIVVGPLCFDTAKAIAEALNPDRASPLRPVIGFGTRNKLLQRARDFDRLPLFVVGKSPQAEAEAFVKFVLPQFARKPFAIIDDGSLHGRSLSDDIRLLGEQAGFKPVTVANFRPLQTTQRTLIRRLQKSGVEALIIAAASEDAITIVKDLSNLNLKWPVAVGEQSALLPLMDGVENIGGELLMVMERQPDISGSGVLATLPSIITDGAKMSVLHGYMLVEIAAQMIASKDFNLNNRKFDTELGPLTFGENGRATLAPFALYRWNGTEPVLLEGN